MLTEVRMTQPGPEVILGEEQRRSDSNVVGYRPDGKGMTRRGPKLSRGGNGRRGLERSGWDRGRERGVML